MKLLGCPRVCLGKRREGRRQECVCAPKTEPHLRHPRLPPSLVKNVLVFLYKVESKPATPTPQPWVYRTNGGVWGVCFGGPDWRIHITLLLRALWVWGARNRHCLTEEWASGRCCINSIGCHSNCGASFLPREENVLPGVLEWPHPPMPFLSAVGPPGSRKSRT